MWTAVLIGCCSLFLILSVLWMIERRVRFKSLAHLPGPVGVPIFGNAFKVGANPVDLLATGIKLWQEFGNVYLIWLAHRPFLLIADAKMIEFILSSTKHITKPRDYNLLSSWLGQGLILSSGQHWKDHRKMITPAFHIKLLENSVEVFNSAGDDLLQKLSKYVDQKHIDIFPYITRYTLDVICETTMGTSLEDQSEEKTMEYMQAIHNQTEIFLRRTFAPWKQINFIYHFCEDYQLEKKGLKILHEFRDNVIIKRIAALNNKKENGENDENDIGIKKRVCFLDLLLEATIDGKPISDAEIREEVDTFMFAGHDTASSAICFCLYELANNPDIQEKLFEEVKIVMGAKKRILEIKDLSELKYLEMVIKEALRKYPSVPTYGRELTEDVYYDGLLLPKGLVLSVNAFFLHRDSELYPDPEKFNPDRFLPENVVNKSQYSYIPFSAGPRNCIGQKFAMYEMKVIIANIIYQFELTSAGPEFEPKLSAEVVLKSANGVHVGLKNRNQ